METMVLTWDVRAKLAAYRAATKAENDTYETSGSDSDEWLIARKRLRDATNALAIALDLDEVVSGSRERCEHDTRNFGEPCFECIESKSVPSFNR